MAVGRMDGPAFKLHHITIKSKAAGLQTGTQKYRCVATYVT